LLGGDKSSQSKDITKAKKFWEDHQRSKAHD
jgi:putative component of toxin-antitoxin plasmid stabilization module